MRWMIVMGVLLVGGAGQARADARISQFVKGYTSEQTSCRIHEAGVAKILDGASMLLEHSSEDGLAADVATLHAAHEAVASYCTALASAIDFLKADPSASYKSLEKQIGERDSHIRTLRAESKKVLADTEPLIQKWIPKINAARIEGDKAATKSASTPNPKPAPTPDPKPAPTPDPKLAPTPAPTSQPAPKPDPKPDPKPVPAPKPEPVAVPQSAKFPSGHSVKLPALGGKWNISGDAATDIADYVEDGTHTSIAVEKYTGVSCNAQLIRLQAKAYGRQAAKEPARPGQAWRVRLAGDSPAIVACAATRTGSALVTFDATDGSHPDLSELAWTMLASFAK